MLQRPDKFATGVGMVHGRQQGAIFYTTEPDLLNALSIKTGFEPGKCARRTVKDLFNGKLRWIQMPPVGVRPVERQ